VPRLAVVVVVIALLLPPGAHAASSVRTAEQMVVEAVNDARTANGLRPLRRSRHLARSAGRFAARLMRLDAFGHGDGVGAGRFRMVGEALSLHRGWRARARHTVRRWLRSPPHRAIVLGSRFRRAGAGLKRGRFGGRLATIWVLRVGRR
jgi:uncharacterized protein YkwD